MTYEFEDYKVYSKYFRENLFRVSHYRGCVTYKDQTIAELVFSSKEAWVLDWAAREIKSHKESLEKVKNIANV